MRRLSMAPLVALGILITCAGGRAWAQGPGSSGPITRPPYSPYLNLVRPGGTPAQNYYGLVRPEFTFRNSIGGLQQEVAATQQLITTGAGGSTGTPVTGHATFFLNTSGYFLTTGRGGQRRGGR